MCSFLNSEYRIVEPCFSVSRSTRLVGLVPATVSVDRSRGAASDALRSVVSLVLDACLQGGDGCCHLSAVAAAPVWAQLHRWRAGELTPQEKDIAEEQLKIVQVGEVIS